MTPMAAAAGLPGSIRAVGQPVTVIEKPSGTPGVIRYETNRVLSGMGHERYTPDRPVEGQRPPDVLARRLFERGGVAAVHVNGNVITVQLATGDGSGIKEIIESLYTYYRPGVEVTVPS
jgi:hypothetical protein